MIRTNSHWASKYIRMEEEMKISDDLNLCVLIVDNCKNCKNVYLFDGISALVCW